jgi:hypothetical protein
MRLSARALLATVALLWSTGCQRRSFTVHKAIELHGSTSQCDEPASKDPTPVRILAPNETLRVLDAHYTKDTWCIHVQGTDGKAGYVVWTSGAGEIAR